MAYTPPPPLPSQDNRPDTFDGDVEAFLGWLPASMQHIVTTVANVNSIAAGGAYAIPYRFSYSSDPIATVAGGWVAWLTSDRSVFCVDTTDSAGAAVGATLDSWTAANGSAIKGHLTIRKQGDPAKWITLAITVQAAPNSLYRAFTVSLVATSKPSDNSPFIEGEHVILQFQRTGDKGDKGDPNIQQHMLIRDQQPQSTSAQSLTGGQWNRRRINTNLYNDIPGASLNTYSADTFTLPPGRFLIECAAPAYAALTHRARLWNLSAGGVQDYGPPAYSGAGGNYATSVATIQCMVTLASTTAFQLDHYVGADSSGGMPSANSIEVFTTVKITRLA